MVQLGPVAHQDPQVAQVGLVDSLTQGGPATVVSHLQGLALVQKLVDLRFIAVHLNGLMELTQHSRPNKEIKNINDNEKCLN